MIKRAEEEIRIAREKGADEYYINCCNSALNAFKCLTNDPHSGISIQITKDILSRLIDSLPLTDLTDNPDEWRKDYSENGKTHYQNRRCGHVWKIVENGITSYSDNERYLAYDIGSDVPYTSGLITRVLNEILPISMPYYPSSKPIKVYCRTFIYDEKNGDFDTKGIIYLIKPDGTRIDIRRYFKLSDNGWTEINFTDYLDRSTKSYDASIKNLTNIYKTD